MPSAELYSSVTLCAFIELDPENGCLLGPWGRGLDDLARLRNIE